MKRALLILPFVGLLAACGENPALFFILFGFVLIDL